MHRLTPYVPRLFAILLLVAASAPEAPSEPEPATLKCCFTNPRYAGICEVEPAKDESCAQVLGYLNNPMSQGKSYCGSTTIRGGWQSVACEPRE